VTVAEDDRVAEKAAALDERLRLIAAQDAAERARFTVPAPKPKAAKGK
jgi:hypothetical protein